MNNQHCSIALLRCERLHFHRFLSFVILFLMTLSMPAVILAQTRTIRGTVSDDDGERLAGVTVTVKDKSTTIQTDADGRFSIQANEGATLIFTYVGKKTHELRVGSGGNYIVKLQSDSKALEEVVVSTGYMTQRKVDLTGAISIVGRNDIVKTPT